MKTEIEQEINRRARTLLTGRGKVYPAISATGWSMRTLKVEDLELSFGNANLTKIGVGVVDELSIWRDGCLLYRERNGESTTVVPKRCGSTLYSALLTLRRNMVLEDLASVADAPSARPGGLASVIY